MNEERNDRSNIKKQQKPGLLNRAVDCFKRYFDELVLLGLAGFLFFVATNVQSGWLFFVVSFILGILIFSLIYSVLNLKNIRIRRIITEVVREDEKVKVSLVLRNKSFLPKFFLLVEDEFPTSYPDKEPPKVIIPYIAPLGKAEASYKRRAYRRGIYTLDELKITTAGFLGFFTISKKFKTGGEKLAVLPRTFRIGKLNLENASVNIARGEKTFSFHGRSHDFAGITEYKPGQEIRFIHWPSTAKHSKLMVKEFNVFSTHSLSVVLDTQENSDLGEGRETTTEYIVRSAASLLEQAARNRYSFDLYSPKNGAVITDKNISSRKGQLRLAEIKAEASNPLDDDLPGIIEHLEPFEHLFIFKVFPFKDPRVLEELIDKRVNTTVVFFEPASFLGDNDPLLEDMNKLNYTSQVEQLQQMGINAVVYSHGEVPGFLNRRRIFHAT